MSIDLEWSIKEKIRDRFCDYNVTNDDMELYKKNNVV